MPTHHPKFCSQIILESKTHKPEVSAEDVVKDVLDLKAEFSGGSYNDGKGAITPAETWILCLHPFSFSRLQNFATSGYINTFHIQYVFLDGNIKTFEDTRLQCLDLQTHQIL